MQRLKKEHDVLFNVCTRTASAFINQESTILNWRVGTERPTRAPQDELSRNDEECAQQANITTPSPHDDWPLRSKQHDKSTIPAIHRAGINCCECGLFPFSSRNPLALPNATALFQAGDRSEGSPRHCGGCGKDARRR